jgi:hypothetical protein
MEQVKFSFQAVSEEINKLLADQTTYHLFYKVGPNVSESQIIDVTEELQYKYRGKAWVGRSPGGIVVDKITPA